MNRSNKEPKLLIPQDSYGSELGGIKSILRFMNMLAGFWTLMLVFLVNADVWGRELFSSPIRGTTDILATSIVGIVYLQLGYAIASGQLTRADLLLSKLWIKAPAINALCRSVYGILGFCVLGIMLYGAWQPTWHSVATREFEGSIGDFIVPIYPSRVILLIGIAISMLVYLILVILDLWRARGLLKEMRK